MKVSFKYRQTWKGSRKAFGQIMAEACIGMSTMLLAWLLYCFMSYMSNNRIRVVMAARDAVWLQANGGAPSDAIPGQFFFANDVNFAQAQDGNQIPLNFPIGIGPSGSAWSNTVTFGMSADQVSGTTQFPFTLLKTQVPFMPATMLDSFMSVTSYCAWPGDVSDYWTTYADETKIVGFQRPSFP